MDTTYLLPPSLDICIPLVLPRLDQQVEIWHVLFRSVPNSKNINADLASKYMTGKRHIPRSYALHYADHCNPRCPQQLYKDIHKAVRFRCPTASERTRCRKQLIEYCDQYVDPLDLALLRPTDDGHVPSQHDISMMLTRMIWHAICHDIAGC